MAITYEFTRVNPLCTCDADGSNTKTHTLEVTMKASESGAGGHLFEAYENGEIHFSGEACVAPDSLDLGTVLNDYATTENWKTALAAAISGQQAEAHEWTGNLTAPAVS
jgi:hypothetical protein